MKNGIAFLLLIFSVESFGLDRVYGKVEKLYSESSKFTFFVSNSVAARQCGSLIFHAYRSNTPHFNEMYSLVLAAFSSNKNVEIVINRCDSGRAVVDHIGAY